MKSASFLLAFAVLGSLALFSCRQDGKSGGYQVVQGQTMGTYYRVTYRDSLGRDFSRPVDSLLLAVNQEISTYIPEATISRFNRSDSTFSLELSFDAYAACAEDPKACIAVPNRHFYANYLAAKVAHFLTGKAFDPTIMPLVNYWGFGYEPHVAVQRTDSVRVDSLRRFVGLDKISLYDRNGTAVMRKAAPGVQLDFGGTGQGYGIDVVAELLELHGIRDYLVDIGGECRARGRNPSGEWWTIGINTPRPDAPTTEFTQLVRLKDQSVSTSGNYRNFYEVDNRRYSHFISPFTGFPEQSNLLSVSVFGRDCLMPDALGTGLMVMGLDSAYALVNRLEGIEALFIYSDEAGHLQTRHTTGLASALVAASD
ncbi:MAG: hypothetical protein RLY31_2427 [Bacteroidota bacterium]|jgi:thiamine biosynthesis lipoprotein